MTEVGHSNNYIEITEELIGLKMKLFREVVQYMTLVKENPPLHGTGERDGISLKSFFYK